METKHDPSIASQTAMRGCAEVLEVIDTAIQR